MTRKLDDLVLGQDFACGNFALSAEEIVNFAAAYDPQPWHLDDAVARETYFAGLCASGLHTQAAAIGLLVRAIADVAVVAGGSLHEARFLAPVRPGQLYAVTARWVSARASASNPARGVAEVAITTRDGGDAAVMTAGVTYIVAR